MKLTLRHFAHRTRLVCICLIFLSPIFFLQSKFDGPTQVPNQPAICCLPPVCGIRYADTPASNVCLVSIVKLSDQVERGVLVMCHMVYSDWSVLEISAALVSFAKPGARTPSAAEHRTRPATVLACPQHRTTVGYRDHVCHRLWNAGSEVRLDLHAVPSSLEHVPHVSGSLAAVGHALTRIKKAAFVLGVGPLSGGRGWYVCMCSNIHTNTHLHQAERGLFAQHHHTK